ncbi:hypothetical protein QOT17_002861 [Balamuthia mandrillaris]
MKQVKPCGVDMGYERLPCWYFDDQEERWLPLQQAQPYPAAIAKHPPGQGGSPSLRIATFNVMYDEWGREHLAHSPLRWRHALKLLRELDADFVGLNEVCPAFQRMLKEEDWVQQSYFISDGSERGETLTKPSANLLLSKHPLRDLLAVPLPQCSRKALVGVCALPLSAEEQPRRICVCSTHFTALTWNKAKRQRQMAHLLTFLEKELPSVLRDNGQQQPHDMFIMGDFNLHKPCEDSIIIPTTYADLWSTLRPHEGGYTFDAKVNKMLAETWPLAFESRRMRLDRIIYRCLRSSPSASFSEEGRKSITAWQPHSICMFGDRPIFRKNGYDIDNDEEEEEEVQTKEAERRPLIHSDTDKRDKSSRMLMAAVACIRWPIRFVVALLAALFDLFRVNLFRRKEDYLFPSDHFGLVATLSLAPSPAPSSLLSTSASSSADNKGKKKED